MTTTSALESPPLTPSEEVGSGGGSSIRRSTICLCMIVKNEAHVIERCLDSVRPVIDHWIIVDTGSTDGTQDLIRAAMKDTPGQLVEQPWKDFAHNRTEALRLSRPCADYSLIIDADDLLELPASAREQQQQQQRVLTADGYKFGIVLTGTSYERVQLVNNKLDWCYRGVLHEFLHCNDKNDDKGGNHTLLERLPWTINCSPDGQRRSTASSTYKRDAELLERVLGEEKDPFMRSRYTFYLAQSWRDCGEKQKSLEAYLKRTKLGFWTEEVYVSLLNAGRLQLALEYDHETVLQTFALATATCPYRAEASHDAARLLRTLQRYTDGYVLATLASKTASGTPSQGLFVETWIYEYGLQDELSLHAYYTNRFKESLGLSIDLLDKSGLSAEYRTRIAANARFALAKLSEDEVST